MSPWNLAVVFETVADAAPQRDAVVTPRRRLTYAQLRGRVHAAASVLAGHGVGAGDRVGLALHNGDLFLVVMLASFELGAVPVNVNLRYTVDELRYLFDDAEPRVVVHEPGMADLVTRAVGGRDVVCLDAAGLDDAVDRLVAAPGGPPPPDTGDRSGDDHYVLYTGGTTGLPKGVVWRHEDVFFAALGGGNPGGEPVADLAGVAEVARGAGGRRRCLPASPFIHGTAHWTALATLLSGGTVVADPDPHFDAERLLDLVEAEGVTQLVVVGDAFARPLADALAAHPDRWDLGALLVVVSGGAVLSPAVRNGLVAHLPWAVVVDGYGTSETGGQARMATWPGRPDAGRPRFQPDGSTAVLDDDGRPVPPGSGRIGRLARCGRLPLGYHRDPERTARTFPTYDGVRWAVTGDLALVEADGRVVLLGRGASTINSGGEKVFPDEVEAALKAHPAVFDAVVVGVPDERWGERVVAVVSPRGTAEPPAPAELQDHCRSSLAAYKVPKEVVVVPYVQRHASGKPDYRWAREAAGQRAGAPR